MPLSPWPGSTSWPRSSRALAVSRDDVAEGFAELKWPARVELLGERPWLVIDGAHNAASAVALADTLRTCFPPAGARSSSARPARRTSGASSGAPAALRHRDRHPLRREPPSVPPETIAAAVVELTGRAARLPPTPPRPSTWRGD